MKRGDVEELSCQVMKQVRPGALCERNKYVLSNIPFPSSFSQNHGVLPPPPFSRKKNTDDPYYWFDEDWCF